MNPHQAIGWLYQFADCGEGTIDHEILHLLLPNATEALPVLLQMGLLIEYQDTFNIQVQGQPCPVFETVDEYTGGTKLWTALFDEEDEESLEVIDLNSAHSLRYRVPFERLPLILANMLPRTESQLPIERIPGVLWECGRIKCRSGTLPAWYVRELPRNYEDIRAALHSYTANTEALLFSGQPVADVYQTLPGVRKVLTIAESLCPWAKRPQIAPMLDNIFRGISSEVSPVPFIMPADNSTLQNLTTGHVYSLSGKQRLFFRYLLDQLRAGVPSVPFSKALHHAGYSSTYTSLGKVFSGRKDLQKLVQLKRGMVSLHLPSNAGLPDTFQTRTDG